MLGTYVVSLACVVLADIAIESDCYYVERVK